MNTWQYVLNNNDISYDPYAEQDATEKRLWSEDGTLLELWTREESDDGWWVTYTEWERQV